jgi:ribosomal protein L37AE/L43A
MTGANWRIDHQCPQCGGPITLAETDRFFTCDYCRVRLHITSEGPLRYRLSPKQNSEEIFYIPYWRFKGTAFAVTGPRIAHCLMDHTRIALFLPELPFSLGVRPQALPLRFAAGDVPGGFVNPVLPLADVIAGMEKQFEGLGVAPFSADSPAKVYVGDTASLIYAPFQVKGQTLHDAVTPGRSYPMTLALKDLILSKNENKAWLPLFLPALCPHCGWNLNGERDSCVFICENCGRAWAPASEGLIRVRLGAVSSLDHEATYIPFWKIKPLAEGIKLKSYADLVRTVNLPKVVRPQWESSPLAFWIPAFKITPQSFLRLGGLFTISPPEPIVYDDIKPKTLYPVNLPLAEAAKGLKIFFASLTVTKRHVVERLPNITIVPEESELILIPFISRGNEFIYKKHRVAIQKAALSHGRNF